MEPTWRRQRSNGPDDQALDYIDLAVIVKPHGLDGEVWVDLDTDFPERLLELRDLQIVGPGGARAATVEYVKGITGGRCIVKLEGVDDRDAAEGVRGQVLRTSRETLPPPPDGMYYDFQIIGLRVVTTNGHAVGRISDILRTGAIDVSETDTGVLIPAIEAIIKEIDLEQEQMLIEPMEGLLD